MDIINISVSLSARPPVNKTKQRENLALQLMIVIPEFWKAEAGGLLGVLGKPWLQNETLLSNNSKKKIK